eukprot:12208199-Ditylum_brightwellii.AAC.1
MMRGVAVMIVVSLTRAMIYVLTFKVFPRKAPPQQLSSLHRFLQLRNRQELTDSARTADGSEADNITVTDDEGDYDDEYDDDDDNTLEATEDERFEKALMKISQRDGVITLEYFEGEKNQNKEEGIIGDEGIDEFGAIDNQEEEEDGEFNDSHEVPEKFELISTNVHVEEDKRKMEHEQIRKLVLDVASKTYRNSGLDIPDDLLAQINENYQTIADRDGFAKHFRKVQKTLNSLNKPEKNVSKLNENLDTGQTEKAGIAEQVVTPDNNEKNEADRQRQRRKIVKKIKVDRNDEIHALPCQCALALVGLQSNLGGGPT